METKPIVALVLDVDGVLTDGTVTCGARGQELKSLAYRDVDAVFEARREGLHVALITGEDSAWVGFVARRLEIEHVVRGAKDKLAALVSLVGALRVGLDEVCYVGDGDRDAPALEAVGLGLAPASASVKARSAARMVLGSRGGGGAVAEAVRLVLETRVAPHPSATEVHRTPTAALAESRVKTMIEESIAVQQTVAAELCGEIVRAADMIARAVASGSKVLIFGNGGSAADAEHMAAELIGRFEGERAGIPALALTGNPSVLTALANDYGYESTFARQVEAVGKAGDVAVAISTSGRSPNVVAAARRARSLGLGVVALTGAGGGELVDAADISLRVPSSSVARIQEAHGVIIHALCALVEDGLFEDGASGHHGG
jgi:D-sedoheptulose 7-phosphate isomerase